MSNPTWTDLPARLASIAARPDNGEIFGAYGHRWRLDPPLSVTELADLESRIGVELPGEYRDFLLHGGSGGAGPAYGLFPVGLVDGAWRWTGDGAELTDLDALARPFPHTAAFNPAAGLPEPPDEVDFDSLEAYDEAAEAYQELHDAVAWAPEHSAGLLYLCHLGCALREVLVVSGPSRGQMWADRSADDAGFHPLLDEDGGRLGFARWYGRWLEAAERAGHGMP